MMELFHGSTAEVRFPLVARGREKVDFGQGFYLTKIREQAVSWARAIAGRRRHAQSILNSYAFDEDAARGLAGLRYKVFPTYDREWLDYVIDCRHGGGAQKMYDVVEGGVANDRVIDTVEDYEKGIITAEQALGQLAFKQVNHQIAILSQDVVNRCLKFSGSVQLPNEASDHA